MSITLYIDTSDFNKVMFAVAPEDRLQGTRRRSSGAQKKSYKIDPHRSHETLTKLDEFLEQKKIKSDQIKKIVVNKGPGSYTGVRVGVTHALALGFAWKVPVKAVAKAKFTVS